MVKLESEAIASLRELKEKQTAIVRGDPFRADLETLAEKAEATNQAMEKVKKARDASGDPEARLKATIQIANLSDRQFEHALKIANLRVDHIDKANTAATTLLKIMGALDTRQPAPDDRRAMIDSTIRAMIQSGIKATDLLRDIKARAADVDFST